MQEQDGNNPMFKPHFDEVVQTKIEVGCSENISDDRLEYHRWYFNRESDIIPINFFNLIKIILLTFTIIILVYIALI